MYSRDGLNVHTSSVTRGAGLSWIAKTFQTKRECKNVFIQTSPPFNEEGGEMSEQLSISSTAIFEIK